MIRRDFRLLIFRCGYDSQVDFATAAGIGESRLSGIMHNRIEPSPWELAAFRRLLDAREVDALFDQSRDSASNATVDKKKTAAVAQRRGGLESKNRA
jgi:hypothetical protein